jgi:hypothetical protein
MVEQVIVVPVVSEERVVDAHPGAPDSGSDTSQLTTTSLVYQPFSPSVPVITGVISGGDVSLHGMVAALAIAL